MIRNIAVLEERDRKGHNRPWGHFDFVSLPLVGHTIVLANGFGGLALLRTEAIEHSPVETEPNTEVAKWRKEEVGPQVRIFVSVLDPDILV
jgi:hypothetical protein